MDWIFQAIPNRYDLREKMISGETGTWLVTRYKDKIKAGDIVYFWLAGNIESRGIYGWGRVVGDGVEYYKDWGHGVDVKYEKVLPNHISSSEIKNLSNMSEHVLFRMAVGTNFTLTQEQAEELNSKLVELYGTEVAPHA
jgi:hypothetical protein